jgi:hypothetical protein
MRRFLYYFPGVSGMNDTMLRERGAWDRFAGVGDKPTAGYQIMAVRDGPAGSGVIVASGQHEPGYRPVEQQWLEGEKFWVGIEDFNPCPGDLLREVGIEGYDLTLGDGLVWRVPLIRRWDTERLHHVPNTPTVLCPVRGADGKFSYASQVKPRYAAADALAVKIFDSFAAERTLPIDEMLADAAAVLAVNYRIGETECALLGLFDVPTAMHVLGLAIDLPRFRDQAQEMMLTGLVAQPAEVMMIET